MDKARLVAQLLPRLRLEGRVDIPDHCASTLGNEHRGVRFLELRTEKPRVTRFGIGWRRHEAVGIESVMQEEQRRAQLAERGQVYLVRAADDDIGVRLRHKTTHESELSTTRLKVALIARRRGARRHRALSGRYRAPPISGAWPRLS